MGHTWGMIHRTTAVTNGSSRTTESPRCAGQTPATRTMAETLRMKACGSPSPTVTARVHRDPAVPEAVRTQHGPRVYGAGYLAGRGCSSGGSLPAMSSNMVVVFQRGDEEPQAFPLGKPGGDISIAWGEPTRRAAIWKVVASPNGNVYVMERKTGSSSRRACTSRRSGATRGSNAPRSRARWSSRSSRRRATG